MFNASLFLDRELELRLRKEQFLHERLSPDSSRPDRRLGRLGRWFGLRRDVPDRERGSEAAEQELLVPDEHLALVLQDGLAVHLLEPGPHRFPDHVSRLKVRWIHQDALPQGFQALRPAERLALAQRLPYERAFLFVDRRLTAMVRPPANTLRGRLPMRRDGNASEPAGAWVPLRREVVEDLEEQHRFSFV